MFGRSGPDCWSRGGPATRLCSIWPSIANCGAAMSSPRKSRTSHQTHAKAETHWGHAWRGPNESYVRPLSAPADRAVPGCARRAVAVRTPQPAALPTGVRVVDAPVQAFGKEAQRVRDAQHDHLPVLERGEAVIEVGGRDRDVLAKPHRVVVVHPGVVARLSAAVLEALEGRARVLVVREAFGAVVAGRSGPVERTLALAPIEADQRAVRARSPEYAVLVDVAAAHADAIFRDAVELAELGLGIEAQESRRAGEDVEGVPDRAVGRLRHHGVGT